MFQLLLYQTLLLVDTYDALSSGVPNAITVFKELKEKGFKPLGIRIDSGDFEYLSKEARIMLDNAGFKEAIIVGSNDLDEYSIQHLKHHKYQQAKEHCLDKFLHKP